MLDGADPVGAVHAGAGQDDPDGALLVGGGHRLEEQIDRRPAEMDEPAVGDEEEDAGDGHRLHPERGDEHGPHREAEPRWSHPPMPEGLTMLPALMRLGPPAVAPYLPAPAPSDAVVEARMGGG